MKKRKATGFEIPPHANAETHKLVMEWLATATKEEFVESLRRAGIVDAEGNLTEHYAPGATKA